MTVDQLSELPQYFGLYFDPATGMTYHDDGRPTGFTFENARWTGPFDLHLGWPRLNPLSFATRETSDKVLAFVRTVAPQKVAVTLDESQRVTGPFTRTVERLIRVDSGGNFIEHSAGMVANSLIRNGEKWTAESLKAEWRLAGVAF